MANARPKEVGPTPSRSYASASRRESRKPIRMYTGVITMTTSHGYCSSHPTITAAPNNNQPPTLSSTKPLGPRLRVPSAAASVESVAPARRVDDDDVAPLVIGSVAHRRVGLLAS